MGTNNATDFGFDADDFGFEADLIVDERWLERAGFHIIGEQNSDEEMSDDELLTVAMAQCEAGGSNDY